MRPTDPKGESGAIAANAFPYKHLETGSWLGPAPGPPHSAADPGELQPGSGSPDRAALA
jgi:hypothetical protein